jgi:GNAT superfamily N-acetyltransferase
MTDMLVKLYTLQVDWQFLKQQEKLGISIRKPIGPEKHFIIDWVRTNFNSVWASEVDQAMSRLPVSCFVAIREGQLIGFSCYDATALGFFGPTGVDEAYRGQGTGKALLLAALLDMKLKGYGYAIIGAIGPADFYSKSVGAVEIPDSTPGLWKDMLEQKREE